ncbi:hypothetical protein BDR26DRAFT_492448 [Obelidium mucronatum]|nr:hypothetical protein BDR26DRAFT_492448 [Obelidium mucronatum]
MTFNDDKFIFKQFHRIIHSTGSKISISKPMRVPARFTSFVLCVICATVASLLCLKFLYRESAVQVVASPETKGKDSIKASPLHDGQLTTTANTPTSAASNTPVETKSNTTTDFIHWLARIGFKSNGMRIVELGPHNRNVIATQSFKAGDIIMEMPIERTVNEESIQKDPLIHFISEKLPNSPWEALMGTFLLKHRNDPEYAPFIQFLPKFVGTPLFWSDSLLQLVQGTDLLRDVNIQRDHIKNTWDKFQPHLPEHLKITFEEFQWGWLVVQSRVWGLELESGVDQCVMSPMLDMVNHNPKPRGEVDYDRTRGSVVMTAAKDIKAGDYIDISYGDKSSYEFLKYYGFTIPDNDANEYCSLSIASNLTSESEEYQYRSAECDFYVQELAKSITDCNLGSNKSNQDGMNPSHDHRGEDPVIWAKIQNAAIEKRLKYPSTIEEDDVLLEAEISKNSSAGSFDVVNAIRVRRGEKICLRAVENHIARPFQED